MKINSPAMLHVKVAVKYITFLNDGSNSGDHVTTITPAADSVIYNVHGTTSNNDATRVFDGKVKDASGNVVRQYLVNSNVAVNTPTNFQPTAGASTAIMGTMTLVWTHTAVAVSKTSTIGLVIYYTGTAPTVEGTGPTACTITPTPATTTVTTQGTTRTAGTAMG